MRAIPRRLLWLEALLVRGAGAIFALTTCWR